MPNTPAPATRTGHWHRSLLVGLLLSTQAATALAQNSLDEFHEDASRLYHQAEYRAALIQAKNALQTPSTWPRPPPPTGAG